MDDRVDAAPRRKLQKRSRRDFEDLEAEERSDDSDLEGELAAAARGSDAVPREVAELQEEMQARGDIGARGFARNLASMEEHYMQEHRAEMAREAARREAEDDLDDLLVPESAVHDMLNEPRVKTPQSPFPQTPPSPRYVQSTGSVSAQSAASVSGHSPYARKQRKLEDDAQSVRKSESGASNKARGQMDSTHKILPTTSDPKLWRVKCFRTGYEKEYCANLINKFAHMVQTHGDAYLDEIPVYSVFAANGAKGYVYIEAHREIDVRNYIKGIRALGAWNIHLVPTKEMIGVFNMATFVESTKKKAPVRPGVVRPRRGSFFKNERVRVKNGQLSGLHCKVVEVLPSNHLRLEAEYASAEWKKLHGLESGQIDLPCDMMEKYFEMGNRVKVLAGKHTGEIGTVSNVMEQERCCAVVSESMENERGFPVEFKVSTWDLTCTTEKKIDRENYGFRTRNVVEEYAYSTLISRTDAQPGSQRTDVQEEKLKAIELFAKRREMGRGNKTKGRRVQIVAGPYKGLLAEIRDEIDDEFVRLQLVTKPKMMQVHRTCIQFCEKAGVGEMLEDMPVAPPTPFPQLENEAAEEEDISTDPWDRRFKLPAQVLKKAEVAWDPTYRKTKLVREDTPQPVVRAVLDVANEEPDMIE